MSAARAGTRFVDRLAGRLADRSPEAAAALRRCVAELSADLTTGDLEAFVGCAVRLCRGTRTSAALAARWIESGPALLALLVPADAVRLGEVVDALAARSQPAAAACLEGAPDALEALETDAREPFVTFVSALAHTTWPDAVMAFERGPTLLRSVAPGAGAALLHVVTRMAGQAPGQGFALLEAATGGLAALDAGIQRDVAALAVAVSERSAEAAVELVASAPDVLRRLGPDALRRWMQTGLELLTEGRDPARTVAWFRLDTTGARGHLASLVPRVELADVAATLELYAQALAGTPLAVRSVMALVERRLGWTSAGATTEGTTIYLPPAVDTFSDRASNFAAYKVAVTHQAGRIEFGSFRYRFGEPGAHVPSTAAEREARAGRREALTPMQRLFGCFDDRRLIAGLFRLVEDTRIDARVSEEYPGIRPSLQRVLAAQAQRRPDVRAMPLRQAVVEGLLRVSLGSPDSAIAPARVIGTLARGAELLAAVRRPEATVQDSAEIAAALYDLVAPIPNVRARRGEQWVGLHEAADASSPLPATGDEVAYDHPPQPELRGAFEPELVQLLDALRTGELDLAGLDPEELREQLDDAVRKAVDDELDGREVDVVVDNLLEEARGEPAPEDEPLDEDVPGAVWHTYDEWDFRSGDYLAGWCRVGERPAPGDGGAWYQDTLRRHQGLVTQTRRQFELLRPESFRRIRRLEDGHEIDLDEAIAFHADKRAGAGPLARFYARRDKIHRDVAVALLLDVSGSTGEPVGSADSEDAGPRIVDLVKEATVLFVEALEAIGDAYGVYAFSGYGRRNCEFLVLKDIEEPFEDRVQGRIGSLEPRTSTRMGVAIRHATTKLRASEAKARILVLLSDGRPEDQGYGRDRDDHEYPVRDTRQALQEARREEIIPFLVTVDREGRDWLREMCGDIGYEVIADVESLPRRLPALYRHLAAH